ncbi:sensor histidine kinase [Devosia sp. Leaf64]|uniref:sensor histidine kinase n=1 Tax=Devosia sp. Leaf64 TaxID=1736229 RepID=UPI0007144ABE|nr:sensor histidine kinase [Devosia sp. Leaf64]KQN77244.1 hypothetical protein ASE94_17245 [Devosia sp. Leaf64]
MNDINAQGAVDKLLDAPDLADALGSDRFRHFLDHLPLGVAISALQPNELITYFNETFGALVGVDESILGKEWESLPDCAQADGSNVMLSKMAVSGEDHIGGFHCRNGHHIEAWTSVIEDDDGTKRFRLLAVAPLPGRTDDLLSQLQEKDTLLRELQHRVKNNLQMITALIRLEARQLPDDHGEAFQRLAGRINSLSLLYTALYEENTDEGIDLGAYLSQVASAVMAAQASEGIRLNLQVDSWPCSINVAMPTGLVVNELMTNALKRAFPEGRGGTIKVHALVDETGCKVIVADDGVGLPDGATWPKDGKLSALIVHTLKENAGARLDVRSRPDEGVTVTIFFARRRAEPEAG